MTPAARFWDAKYAHDASTYGTEPNAWLASRAAFVRPGDRAFVPADGEGRNGVWLAGQGAHVTTLDASRVAVARARRLAAARGVALDAGLGDVFAHDWTPASLDLIGLVFFHLAPPARRRLHRLCVRALAPGGRVLIEGFTPRHLANRAANPRAGGPDRADMLFTRGLLREDFAGLCVRELGEETRVLSEGAGHDGPAALIHGVFEKAQP